VTQRVIVVGAGFAGLAAAHRLAAAGADVTVLERSGRLGGRVRSAQVGSSRIEMGAEFVTSGYTVLPSLVSELGLRLAPMGMSFGDREPRGGIPATRAAALQAAEKVAAAVEQGAGEGLSFAGLVASLDIGPAVRDLVLCRVQVSYAHPPDDIAASAVRDVAHLFDDAEAHRIEGGNDALARRLTADLAVRLETAVERISWHGSHVTVDGEQADACVLATPAPALSAIAFEPALPEWKTGALSRVAYGHAAKLFARLAGPVAPGAVISVPERFWTWTALGDDGEAVPLVSAFAGSAPAVAALAVDRGPETYLDRVRALRPDLPFAGGEVTLATWPDGAYSTRRPDRPAADDALLAQPCGRLAFAGEHTAGEWFGTMEGALRSGLRAADELLATAAGP
jgi:monoamine oxidase